MFILFLFLIIILAICIFNTLNKKSLQIYSQNKSNDLIFNEDLNIELDKEVKNLSKALTFKTIAKIYPETFDETPFLNFHEFLKNAYPLCFSKLKFEKIGGLNLLFTWQGENPKLPGILLMAHQDVVPIESGTENDWKYDPFSGTISDGYIWGRGALDNKNQLVSILASVEILLKENFCPERTIYLAFGCDEEVGGIRGARIIAEELKNRGVNLLYVLDEGGIILKNMLDGFDKPVNLVGIAEKGYLTLTIEANDEGGHSSMPPKHTSLGRIAKAITKIENKQFNPRIDGVIKYFLRFLAPELNLFNRFILSNLWIFKPLVFLIFSKSKNTNALIRTTQAVTMAKGSNKENVLPQKSSATINFRIIPGESTTSVKKHLEKAIKDKSIKIIDPPYSLEPSIISNPYSSSFKSIQKILSICFPETITVPYLVLGATDSRYYESISENVYRFSPVLLSRDELSIIHGTNERISIDFFIKMIKFFYLLIKETSNKNLIN